MAIKEERSALIMVSCGDMGAPPCIEGRMMRIMNGMLFIIAVMRKSMKNAVNLFESIILS